MVQGHVRQLIGIRPRCIHGTRGRSFRFTGLLVKWLTGKLLVDGAKMANDTYKGVAGTILSCFLQMFYVSFLFPWCIKHVAVLRGSSGNSVSE